MATKVPRISRWDLVQHAGLDRPSVVIEVKWDACAITVVQGWHWRALAFLMRLVRRWAVRGRAACDYIVRWIDD